ncbi:MULTISPECIES: DUF1576 domain-containing protein [Clostridium]|uniref:DUF1576 domain-containing protein n=1 Tax=Clostridium cadaveris TaxID=1529 RepID=A0A1I2Q519_9CLOT|nr:DUF1576 domain-containing protein [Clostridium cadaveris]MDU4953560.1 DUF1576 domain-containing protein [Clostridium sp.]MDM8312254.1 DUF1576 domain-containing protein [Clostridium cadaveris]NME66123.1 DUF1576 domain-containing protein [Clostridium cadaveris]NWK12730.1 DUF1576 domain-containing protein [Clostridium cadaveris]PWL51694.1 MAG: DUF1576 domain-containing protein [Clostridium cadaveris]
MRRKLYPSYSLSILIFSIFVIFGLIVDGPINVFNGLKEIIFSPDILITDYVAIGGIGAAFVNAGLVTLLSIALLIIIGIKPNGSTLMSLWLMAGFSFFGKNVLNVWPIILGVWLYSKYKKEPFLNYSLIALLGTSLAPAVSQLSFVGLFPVYVSIPMGCAIGIGIGFILSPLAANCTKLHQGYNLYNVGFAAGLLGTMLMAIFRALGITFESKFIWSTGNNLLFGVFLIVIFLILIGFGVYDNKDALKNTSKITKHSGRLVSDYYIMYGKAAYINMGILGILSTIIVIIIGGELNGPTMGGIMTIVGFGAFGKHPLNVIPIMIGALLSSVLNIWGIASPQMLISMLFSTTLAPIAGQFGWKYGILAGFLHVCTVMNTGYLHGGLNLYNNGLAGGFVAMTLIPLIHAFRREQTN